MPKPLKQTITRYVVDVPAETRAACPIADVGGKLYDAATPTTPAKRDASR